MKSKLSQYLEEHLAKRVAAKAKLLAVSEDVIKLRHNTVQSNINHRYGAYVTSPEGVSHGTQ